MSYKNPIVFYHKNCADGFGAAYSIWLKYKNEFEYYAADYNDKMFPNIIDRDVFMVDFSYKKPVIEDILKTANSVTILDHHKSAENNLKELFSTGKIKGVFDLDRSGAMITWQFFNPELPIPKLIEHIQDRDLWKFNLENTREIQSNIFSYPYDFEVWDKLMKEDTNRLFQDGAAIDRKHLKDVNELIRGNMHFAKICEYMVPCCNIPYIYSSEAGHIMSKGYAFAFCYTYCENGIKMSFRSQYPNQNAIDVSEIAERFGGGGHAPASGCEISHDRVSWENGIMIIS
jgi:oligoribonuclease NrnB/cAMP/cGMP phosphodiesterase (DHH superfamily)